MQYAADARLHLSIDAVAIMTVLDANDRPIRKVLYDLDDRVIRRVAFCYGEHGLLLEEGEVVGGSIRDDFRNVFRYDALGRRIGVVQRWGDGDVAQKSFEQNLSQSWTERFAYQYDDYENWIQRTTETILHTGETRVSIIEQRDFNYY
jgi:hypothetical protein